MYLVLFLKLGATVCVQRTRSGEGQTSRLGPKDQEAEVEPWAGQIGHRKSKST